MAHTILTAQEIAREALAVLKNMLIFGATFHRDKEKNFAKVPKNGGVLDIRLPNRFVVTDGSAVSKQDIAEEKVTITIDKRKHVAWEFSMQDLTLSIEEYSERYIQPAMAAIVNQIESDCASEAINLFAHVGTAGTAPSSFRDIADIAEMLDNMSVPKEGRICVMNPKGHYSVADGLKGVFQPTMVNSIIKESTIGRIAGIDMFSTQNIKTHIKGVQSGAPVVNGAAQTGLSLVTDGWTAAQNPIIKKGDLFTIAGVYAVNPVSRETLDFLQQFVCTADANSDGAGNAAIGIYPSIITSGAKQTVSASPADNAAINVLAANHVMNMAYTKDTFALCMVALELPDSAKWGHRETHDGYSVRLYKYLDGDNDTETIRLDVLYGIKTVRPETGVRLLG